MKKIKKRILTAILSLSVTTSSFTLTGISVANAQGKNNKVEEISSDNLHQSLKKENEDSNKSVRVIVELEANSIAEQNDKINEYDSNLQNSEEKIKTEQEKIIDDVEKITQTQVVNQMVYLVNSFSIDAKIKDIEKIKEVKGIKNVYRASEYKVVPEEEKDIDESKLNDIIDSKCKQRDGAGTVIAILDSGVNYLHKDMKLDEGVKNKFSKSEWEEKIKALGHGKYYSEKVPFGYDYSANTDEILVDPENEVGLHFPTHGYHVAGIASANGGIKGVAPNAQIIGMKVFDDKDEAITSDDIVRAIEDAIKLGADVINMSLGLGTSVENDQNYLQRLVDEAQGEGVVCCVSVGNEGRADNYFSKALKDASTVGTPSVTESCIAVGAANTNQEGNNESTSDVTMANFSSWGPTNDLHIKPEIAAPGEEINSLFCDNEYRLMSGTSMSAPYVAGASALVISSLKDKGINLENEQLSDMVKTMLMNNADPLIDSKMHDKDEQIPYSIRQQGAGMIDVKGAEDATVTATYDNKAKVELGEFDDTSKKIDIEVKNYGKNEVTYSLSEQPLYSDITKSEEYKYISGLEKIDEASIKYNEKEITIKPGETKKIEATLSIPNDLESEKYIEGYITLNGKNEQNLSLPILGFYGDWENEPIFDSSVYDSDSFMYYGSRLKSESSVLGYVLEKSNNLSEKENDNGIVDKYYGELCAISPNGDGVNDIVYPSVNILRNAEKIGINVLDSDKNVLRTLIDSNNAQKTLEEWHIYSCSSMIAWDGKLYNKTTGKYEIASDGQYYIQVWAKLYEDGKEQSITMPVKIDTQAPSMNAKIEKLENNTAKILLDAKDNVAINNEFNVNYNGNDMTYYFDRCQKNENGQYEVLLDEYEIGDYVCVTVNDMAGNKCVSKIIDENYDKKYKIYQKLEDNMCVSFNENNEFILSGYALDGINVSVNGTKVDKIQDTEQFRIVVPIKEDEKNLSLNILVTDKDDKTIEENNYTLIVDRDIPVIENVSIDNSVVKEQYKDYLNNTFYYVYLLKDEEIQNINVNCSFKEENVWLERCFVSYDSKSKNEEVRIPIKQSNDGYYFEITKEEIDDANDTFVLCLVDKNHNKDASFIDIMTDKDKYDERVAQRKKIVEEFSNNEQNTNDDETNIFDGLKDLLDDWFLFEEENFSDIDVEYFAKKSITSDMLNSDGTFTFKGKLNSNVKELKVNNEVIKINEDMTYSFDKKLEKGINKLFVDVESTSRKEKFVINVIYNQLDVNLKLPSVQSDECIITCSDVFDIAGTINTYASCYDIVVNGDVVYTKGCGKEAYGYEDYVVSHDGKMLNEKFSHSVKLEKGMNILDIVVKDDFGNEVKNTVKINCLK